MGFISEVKAIKSEKSHYIMLNKSWYIAEKLLGIIDRQWDKQTDWWTDPVIQTAAHIQIWIYRIACP